MLEEISTFLYCAVANFNTTGAIAPSSQALAKAITAEINRKKGPANVLEVGAGTGVFTKEIIHLLGKEDRLDICEINPKFLKYLRKMVHDNNGFKTFKGQIRVLPVPVQKLPEKNHYDYIISGLPLNSFPPALVTEILKILLRLLKPNGWISYFEYMGIRNVKSIYASKEDKTRLREVNKILQQFIEGYQVYHLPVWRNFPPAYARHCRKKPEKSVT